MEKIEKHSNLPTLTPEGSLNSYLLKIRKFPMLEPEQEYILAKNWREKGDRESAHTLVTSHLRLVAKIAMGYRGYGLPVGELISEGNIGLMQAVKKFDPERGFRLATYAMWWIKASIQEYILRSWSLVKIGTTAAQKKLFFNLRKLKNQIFAIESGDMTDAHVKEIANRLDVNEDEVISMNRRMAGQEQSLNAKISDEEQSGQWQDWIVDEKLLQFSVGDLIVREGEVVSIDGTTGCVYLGELPVTQSPVTSYLEGSLLATAKDATPVVKAVDRILQHADEIRKLYVRANADTPEDAQRAKTLGAQGIGLCRTEHMFLGERRSYVERVVLAENEAEQNAVIAEMLPLQQADFVGILKAMSGYPVTVRLLDPPLHEFLPDLATLSAEMATAEALNSTITPRDKAIFAAVKRLHEANPMLGLRGVRLGILIPELFKMQVRALVLASLEVKKAGFDPKPELMIPLVATQRELLYLRETLEEEIKKTLNGAQLEMPIGTMIETPRAAITATRLADYADFFSFGTNDLTQLTWAFSRDDVESTFLPRYLDLELLPFNPFESLDQDGVGLLVKIARDQARAYRKDFKLGCCRTRLVIIQDH